MSAAEQFLRAGIDRGDEPDVVPGEVMKATEPRASIDLDQLQETAWAIAGAVLYLLGVVVAGAGLTVAFGWWAGGLLVLVAGALPSGYSLKKAGERRAERERLAGAAHFRAEIPGALETRL